MDFTKMRAIDIAEGIRAKTWNAFEVVMACLQRTKAAESSINACVTLLEEEAYKRARYIDEKIIRGEYVGKLAGVPFFAKDNICTKGIRTTCGSKMLEQWEPTYNATVIERMEAEGAILLGKTNMDEFSMGDSTETSYWGVTKNPRDLSRIPGGSSGGSAAAVAAGYAPIALGSDTGGSVRQPAAFCGVHGFKPTYGQVSRYGIVGYSSSMDQISPFARSIEDIALVMDVIASSDPKDATCNADVRDSFTKPIYTDLKGKTIGVLKYVEKTSMDSDLFNTIKETESLLSENGAKLENVELPISIKYGVSVYYIMALADASTALACFDGIRMGHHVDGKNLFDMYTKTRTDGFGSEVKKRILAGTALLSSGYYDMYYRPARKIRTRITQEIQAIFKKCDALLMPVSPILPHRMGSDEKDKTQHYYLSDLFTVPANLAGIPALSLNMGFNAQGLPLNIQLLAPRFSDADLLTLGTYIERYVGSPRIASFTEVE